MRWACAPMDAQVRVREGIWVNMMVRCIPLICRDLIVGVGDRIARALVHEAGLEHQLRPG